MKDLNDYIMYFTLLSLYLKDRESNVLDPLPRMALEVYLFDEIVAVIEGKFNISEKEIMKLSRQKISSTEAHMFLAKYAQKLVSE